MLILHRKKGQSLTIDDKITLTVLEAGSEGVKLAIDAPRDISILRSELKEATVENKMASKEVSRDALEKLLKEPKL